MLWIEKVKKMKMSDFREHKNHIAWSKFIKVSSEINQFAMGGGDGV